MSDTSSMSASSTSFGLPSHGALAAAPVLVVGDAMLDRYWFGEVDRISPEAPVPVVHVRREEYRLGGAANVAVNVRALGGRPCLLSAVGMDEPATRIRSLLTDGEIAHDLCADGRFVTTVKLRVSGRAQQLLRVDFEQTPHRELLAGLQSAFEQRIRTAKSVIFSDYGKGGLAHIALMVATAREAGVPTLIDPKGEDFRPYAGATVVTPNRAELARVVGRWSDEATLAERAQNLRSALKLDAMLVTRSEEGMSLFDDEGALHIPAQAREVFDVTGAGDTVIAVLGALIASGMSIREAMPFANRAGAIVVGRFGTASVTYDEILA